MALVPFEYYQPSPLDDDLEAAIAEAEAALAPAGRQAAFDGVRFAAKILGLKHVANDVLSGYAAILGEIPAGLLSVALRDGLAEQTYHVLPAPGLFVSQVRSEWDTRKHHLSLLKRHRERVRLASRTRPPTERPKLEAVTFRPVPVKVRKIE
jgi:hypothetical protein